MRIVARHAVGGRVGSLCGQVLIGQAALVVVVNGQIVVDGQKAVLRPVQPVELVELLQRGQLDSRLPLVRDKLVVDQRVVCESILA